MALTHCRECKHEVSQKARTCPRCGAPRPWQQDWQGTGVDWKTQQTFAGYPLVHVAFGRDRTGKLRVAKGIIAIGQFAVGLITIAQFGIGFLFGFGQFLIGSIVIAQFAGAFYFGLGQLACGYIAIGQLVLAQYGLARFGYAQYLWNPDRQDPIAVEFFKAQWQNVVSLLERFTQS